MTRGHELSLGTKAISYLNFGTIASVVLWFYFGYIFMSIALKANECNQSASYKSNNDTYGFFLFLVCLALKEITWNQVNKLNIKRKRDGKFVEKHPG